MLFQIYARRFILAASLVLVGISCNSIRTEAPEASVDTSVERPNIIWIVGENLNLDLGIFGAKNVATPNLASLGRNGGIYPGISFPGRVVRKIIYAPA